MSDFVLYNYYRSSTSYRARLAFAYKGIPYIYKPLHLLNNGGEQHLPEFRKINPMGGVPALVHGEVVLSQSRAIIEYLDGVRPENPLFPQDPYKRAQVQQICDAVNCEIHPLGNLRVQSYLGNVLHIDEAKRTEWLFHWNKLGLTAIETMVQKTADTYCFGSTFTAADIFIMAHFFTANRFKIPLQDYPTLNKINQNCLKLKQLESAHPSNQIDTPKDV